jgi:hypothetical protein
MQQNDFLVVEMRGGTMGIFPAMQIMSVTTPLPSFAGHRIIIQRCPTREEAHDHLRVLTTDARFKFELAC